jgi:hypothetical protein
VRTVVPSPKALLRAWFAEQRGESPLQCPNTDTAARTLGFSHFRPGVLVREKDGRHVARIDAILWSVAASVTFIDSGWKAEFKLEDLELAGNNS